MQWKFDLQPANIPGREVVNLSLLQTESLRSINFPEDVDTSRDDVVAILFNPGLSVSARYDRGVGFFSSAWLKHVAEGLAPFAERGGKMRLITSPKLRAEDWAAIKQGDDARNNSLLLEALQAEIDDLKKIAKERPVQLLAWMVADELLEIRIGVPVAKLDGDYHPKLGIFMDEAGDFVVFHGSQNETDRGFRNYESLDIYTSWSKDRDAKRAASHRSRFERLWEQRDPNVRCYSLPSAIRRNLIQFTEGAARPYGRPGRSSAELSGKWQHQAEAVGVFLRERAGVLEMATGTGKTRTALDIHEELTDRGLVNTTVVTMSGTDLLDQWYRALITRTALPVYRQYGTHKEGSAFFSCRTPRILLTSRQQLSATLPHMDKPTVARGLLICDEVHGVGSPAMIRDLSGEMQRFCFRLGLSATPEREYDEIGSAFIEEEIGPVIFEFTLEDAIRKGILCEFDYTALPYELTDEDKEAIRQVFRRHHARRAAGEASSDEALYRDLALIRKTSVAKIPLFEQHLVERPDLYERALIFVETREYGEEVQKRLLDAGIVFGTYYQGAEAYRLRDFAAGRLQCLVSCHRLSEGIDIQSVRNIVLFASARARLETIQRLGRCLRVDPANPEKRAHVLDFVDLTSNDNFGKTADQERFDWFTSLSKVTRAEGV